MHLLGGAAERSATRRTRLWPSRRRELGHTCSPGSTRRRAFLGSYASITFTPSRRRGRATGRVRVARLNCIEPQGVTSWCSASTSVRRRRRRYWSTRRGRSSTAPGPSMGSTSLTRLCRTGRRGDRGGETVRVSARSPGATRRACGSLRQRHRPLRPDRRRRGRATASGDSLRDRFPRGLEIEELNAELGADQILAIGGSPLSSQAVGPSCVGWEARRRPSFGSLRAADAKLAGCPQADGRIPAR